LFAFDGYRIGSARLFTPRVGGCAERPVMSLAAGRPVARAGPRPL